MKFTRDYPVSLAPRGPEHQSQAEHLHEVQLQIEGDVDSWLYEHLGPLEEDVVVRVTVEIEDAKKGQGALMEVGA